MLRNIDDKDYIECLPSDLYRHNYANWRQRMLDNIEIIVQQLSEKPVEAVMEEMNLTTRDIALLVRLKFFTEEEVEKFDLRRIEKLIPL